MARRRVVHRANAEAHTLIAGAEGLDRRSPSAPMSRSRLCYLPRAGGTRGVPPTVVESARRVTNLFKLDDQADHVEFPSPAPPPNVVATADVDDAGPSRRGACSARPRHRRGSRRTASSTSPSSPGRLVCPPHCHSAEEELFVVLGEGTLSLAASCLLGDDQLPVQPGQRRLPPGRHRRRSQLPRRPGRTHPARLRHPRAERRLLLPALEQDLLVRGVGVIGRLERLDYWDGEPE